MTAEECTQLVEQLLTKRGARSTQSGIADLLGCHSRTLVRYKRGERKIPAWFADRLRLLLQEQLKKQGQK